MTSDKNRQTYFHPKNLGIFETSDSKARGTLDFEATNILSKVIF